MSAATQVAGLPVLVRLARQLEQAGAQEIRLVTAEPDGQWPRLLEEHGAGQRTLLIEITPDEAPAGVELLDARGIYAAAELSRYLNDGAAPEPRVLVMDAATGREADAWLWRSVRKSMSHDGPVAYFFARPFSNLISRALLPFGVSPNAVTVVGLLVGLASGLAAGLGGYWPVLAATLLFYLGMILDCVDGDLARLTLAASRLGQWLDSVVDDLSIVFLTVGMGIGLWRETGQALYLWGGLGAAFLVVVGQVVIYAYLARGGGPIDTAKYPWFFMGREGMARQGRRSLLGWLAFLPRRDSLALVFVILAAVGVRPLILLALAAGGAVYFVLLGIDRLAKGLGWVEEAP